MCIRDSTGGDAAGDVFNAIEGVLGTALGDTMTGGTGNDYFDGNGGNDTMYGSAGADTLIGGAGTDTLDYSASTSGVTVQNNSTITGAVVSSGGDAASDVVVGFEAIVGSNYADTIYDLSGANASLTGNDGNDYLDGGAGADTLDLSLIHI